MKQASYYRKILNQNYYYEAIINVLRCKMEQECDKHIYECPLDNTIDKGRIEIDMPAKDILVDQESLTVIINRYDLDTNYIKHLIIEELQDAGYDNINAFLEVTDLGVLTLQISFRF